MKYKELELFIGSTVVYNDTFYSLSRIITKGYRTNLLELLSIPINHSKDVWPTYVWIDSEFTMPYYETIKNKNIYKLLL